MSRLVSRDPFARTELHSERVYDIRNNDCHWCGRTPRTPRKNTPYLHRYWIEHDGGRKEDIRGLFCSADCMRSHHGH